MNTHINKFEITSGMTYRLAWDKRDPGRLFMYHNPNQPPTLDPELSAVVYGASMLNIPVTQVSIHTLDTNVPEDADSITSYMNIATGVVDGVGVGVYVKLDDSGRYDRLVITSPRPGEGYGWNGESWVEAPSLALVGKINALELECMELSKRIADIEATSIRSMSAILLELMGGDSAGANDKAYFLKYQKEKEDIRVKLGGIHADVIILKQRLLDMEKSNG